MTSTEIIKELNTVGGIDIAHASQLARDKKTTTAIEIKSYVQNSFKTDQKTAEEVANFYLNKY